MHTSGLIALALALVATPAPALAQSELPIRSHPGAPDGQVAPFEGSWSIMKPGGDATAFADSCVMPAVLLADGPTRLRYDSSTGARFDFDLAAENGGTAWSGELARLAVWRDTDSFLLYPRSADGTPDTAGAQLYQRCPTWPRQSYAGAVAGALEPFVGRWQEAVPPARGAEPLMIVGSCDDPTTYEISGPGTLLRTIAGEPDRTIPIQKRGNDTVIPNPMRGYAPSVAIWVSPDRWHFHGIDLYGATDWNAPVIYTRCAD